VTAHFAQFFAEAIDMVARFISWGIIELTRSFDGPDHRRRPTHPGSVFRSFASLLFDVLRQGICSYG
jgi:hypothetical protein